MEEQKKDELEIIENSQEKQEGASEEKNNKSGLPTRSYVMMTLAGIYLLYTGFSLCKNVLAGEDGGNIGFLLAGVVFLVLGCVMLFASIRNAVRKSKAKKEQEAFMAAEEKVEEKGGEEVLEQDSRSMSISQRAHLTDRLEEETEG